MMGPATIEASIEDMTGSAVQRLLRIASMRPWSCDGRERAACLRRKSLPVKNFADDHRRHGRLARCLLCGDLRALRADHLPESWRDRAPSCHDHHRRPLEMRPGMISTDKPKMGRRGSQRRSPGFLLATILIAATAASAGALAADPAAKRWTEDELVAGYRELASTHKLEDAVRTP